MELLKSVKRRSRLSDILYIVFNLTFAVVVFGFAVAFSPPWIAYLVVILSKWRVFAVRPRFWFANIQANTVDLLVGLSVVTLIWQSEESIVVQTITAILYALWLLFLKPRSKRILVVLQAGAAQFLSFTALFTVAYGLYASAVIAISWLIGYVVARHILSHYDDEDGVVLSLAWGVITAELAWLAYHSTTAYGLIGVFMVPQIALIVSLIGFAAYSVYHNYRNNDARSEIKGIRRRLLFVGLALIVLIGREVATLI